MTDNLDITNENIEQPEIEMPAVDPVLLADIEKNLKTLNIDELYDIARVNPSDIHCWVALSIAIIETTKLEKVDQAVMAYAYARIGYHRGLDILRTNGWFGSGFIRSSVINNRGFLAALALVAITSKNLSYHEESSRCMEFLELIDPNNTIEINNMSNAAEFLFPTK